MQQEMLRAFEHLTSREIGIATWYIEIRRWYMQQPRHNENLVHFSEAPFDDSTKRQMHIAHIIPARHAKRTYLEIFDIRNAMNFYVSTCKFLLYFHCNFYLYRDCRKKLLVLEKNILYEILKCPGQSCLRYKFCMSNR